MKKILGKDPIFRPVLIQSTTWAQINLGPAKGPLVSYGPEYLRPWPYYTHIYNLLKK